MKVFILLSVVAAALASRQCGENQHYESCGTACPLTCKNYDNPPRACVLMCNPGCHCDKGYVKTEDGQCVRPEECPARAQQCGENQHYESCGTACPLTCENYDDPPVACVLMCNPGCHCDKGYVKTKDGRCVRPEECPARAQQVCGENQRYLECGSACPLTCDNYANPPRICPAMCVSGCHCETGFVKTRDGRCVRPEQCSASGPLPIERSCFGEPDPGMCRAYIPLWYYDVSNGKCHEFVYGGCQGNGNRYATEEECMEHCQDVKLRESSVNRCDLPAETGPCKALFRKFYFDKNTGQCQRFIYGGCAGNENNFETFEECDQACGNGVEESSVNRCDLPAETGPCRALFRKFYFDKTTGQCQRFIYGGCGGNENNFETIDECNQACGFQSASDVCTLPSETGLCRGFFPMYYWDTESGRCEKFIYGGCGGNGNKFGTLEECEKTCA